MRIKELVEAVPVGSSTQPAPNPNTPPQQQGQQPAAPGQQPAAPGQQPAAPGKPQQPTLGNQQPNATATASTAALAKPSPEVQQGMQAMSDQFTALKLKYDQLQKQILNPPAPATRPTPPAPV